MLLRKYTNKKNFKQLIISVKIIDRQKKFKAIDNNCKIIDRQEI